MFQILQLLLINRAQSQIFSLHVEWPEIHTISGERHSDSVSKAATSTPVTWVLSVWCLHVPSMDVWISSLTSKMCSFLG